MKIEVETKITILEGKEEGRTFVEKTITNTDQRYTEYGIIETLRYEWNRLIPYELSELKGENKLTCERNICLQNEYNNIGCEDCVVTKGEKE